MHPTAAEPGDLARGIQARNGIPVDPDDLAVEVGLQPAERLAREDVEPHRDEWAALAQELSDAAGELSDATTTLRAGWPQLG